MKFMTSRETQEYEAEKADSPATCDETKKVLSTYSKPKRSIQMEIFNFQSCK